MLTKKTLLKTLLFSTSCLLLPAFCLLSPAFAHSIKIDADVGGTLHIEPNDTPRAGEPAQAWFALTRKGGKVITLQECNCQLAVYPQPQKPGQPALFEPSLKPVQAEKYQGIPGAEITFPKPGTYQLALKGKPATAESFQPFELKFQVTVAAGKATEIPKSVQNPTQTNLSPETQGVTGNLVQPAIILGILLLSGIGVFFVLGTRDKS
jgi:hypothetical protein